MAERKRDTPHSMHRSSKRKHAAQGFYTPFSDLDQHLACISRRSSNPAPQRDPPFSVATHPDEEERLFREAMSDVVPLVNSGHERVPHAPRAKRPPRFLAQEELEVYAQLVDLVAGEGPFELTCSDEYVDGAIVGLSPKILKKLRNGDFSYQAYIDLHGCYREEAREEVIRFVQQSFVRKYRCILIVSGRGLNSRDKLPVLKHGVVTWLTRSPLKRLVLAFASARAHDGGAGAFYVLLRRNEGKAPFVVPAG